MNIKQNAAPDIYIENSSVGKRLYQASDARVRATADDYILIELEAVPAVIAGLSGKRIEDVEAFMAGIEIPDSPNSNLTDKFLASGSIEEPSVMPYDGLRRKHSQTWGGYDENGKLHYWNESFKEEFKRGRWVKI